MAKTYNELYMNARKALRNGGIEASSLEARELICYAAGKDHNSFFQYASLYATDDIELRLNDLVARRLSGEPAAYLIGEWEFYGMPLDISRDVLIPRADTEVIAERAIEIASAKGSECRVLDLCAGSGCIGLAVAKHVPQARVVLADVSEEALHICRQNGRRNNLNKNIMVLRADALHDPLPMLGTFDLIVSNPPYIRSGDIAGLDPSVRDYEPHLALDGGEDGLDFYRAIAERWQRILRPNGVLLFEVGYDQADAVEQILIRNNYHDINTLRDTQGIWRVVEGCQ